MISADRQVVVELISGNAHLASASRAASAAAEPQSLRTRSALQYGFHDPQIRSTVRASVSSSAEWPSGWAEHSSIPLDQLISEANEYADRKSTSELKSLMRSSYAVFCLKEKNNVSV